MKTEAVEIQTGDGYNVTNTGPGLTGDHVSLLFNGELGYEGPCLVDGSPPVVGRSCVDVCYYEPHSQSSAFVCRQGYLREG